MARLRLRTQLLIATLLIICALLGALLLMVRHTVRSEIAEGVRQSTAASLHAFENVQQDRDLQFSRTAAMLAELPTLKAMMATQHALTIQDASEPLWKLAGSQLFILSGADGRFFAFHVSTLGWDRTLAEQDLKRSIEQGDDAAWWYGNGQLYRVFLHAILAGSEGNQRQLGIIAVGYQIDSTVAQQLALASGGQIALTTGGEIIASTLSPSEEKTLQGEIRKRPDAADGSREIVLDYEPFQVDTILIHRGPPASVSCYVLMSMQPANAFLSQLNQRILILGLSAFLLAALLLTFVSRTITHPLDDLVAGVRALAKGDYAYSIRPSGSSEVAELGDAFSKMRGELLASEQRRFAIERVAAFGRAASSISHDLRHYLAAVVANAEFLYEAEKLKLNRDEIYDEIKTASEQMTDLLDSLRELSREESSISPHPAEIDQTIRHAVDAVRARAEMRTQTISLRTSGDMAGIFDPKKIERAFFNLVLNACEASSQTQREIEIEIRSLENVFEIRVTDHGTGVPAAVRATLFDPFVSFGKSNGTGLGLAIVNKVIHDHGGSTTLEHTSPTGTTFLVKLPRTVRVLNEPALTTARTI
ncbi:MAG: HAMP domain-containing sensor histidine kinase [Candidatus Acidiferrales bacterium]